MKYQLLLLPALLILLACKKEKEEPRIGEISIDSLFVNDQYIPNNGNIHSVDFREVQIRLKFNVPVDTAEFNNDKLIITGGDGPEYAYWFDKSRQDLYVSFPEQLDEISGYRIFFDVGPNFGGTVLHSYNSGFTTTLDSTPNFPVISDDSLLTLVQKKTFDYFWEYGHPVSGLSRDRLGGGDVVTSGGSGFGMMAILIGIERGFISREEAAERLSTMINFLLKPSTSRFHGAFPHWLNGSTGMVFPFSAKDNGGDLVETAFLMQGLLTVRQYFKNGSFPEISMCDSITKLWEAVEWDWYRRNDQNRLFWHWSPNYAWDMNMAVTGWNEAVIVYILAASSPANTIPKIVYDEGWARNGAIINGDSYYDVELPLGERLGGPMFFAHYSFLGLDPRNLEDAYADYWQQNTAHALINYAYCVDNPGNYPAYGKDCWGLTASDIPNGYSASSPTNDLGVIAPTAAIASMPYTPENSMDAMKFFYYVLGDKLWGQYGFYDAFSLSDDWFASSFLAIDQGPIICMIENYRTGLLWNLFMQDDDIKSGLIKLGFTY
jgi:hypothetical protein